MGTRPRQCYVRMIAVFMHMGARYCLKYIFHFFVVLISRAMEELAVHASAAVTELLGKLEIPYKI